MAVLESLSTAAVAEVGAASSSPLHVTSKPLPHGALGHYRVVGSTKLIATQAAGSRLWEIQNPTANLLVIQRLKVSWLQTGAHTAAIEDTLDFFKATGFTVVDTTGIVTPAISRKRTSMGTPGSVVKIATATGVAAGMTGGNPTLEASPIEQLPKWLVATMPTTEVKSDLLDFEPDMASGTHQVVLAQNEGLVLRNGVLLGAAAASSVYIACSFAEVTAY